MLKTTLKIATLSAVAITFLSACGASDTLNNLANGDATDRYYTGYSLNVNSGEANSGEANSGEASNLPPKYDTREDWIDYLEFYFGVNNIPPNFDVDETWAAYNKARIAYETKNVNSGTVNYGNKNSANVNNPLPVIDSTVASSRYTGQYSNGGTLFIEALGLIDNPLAFNSYDDTYTITYAETQDTFAMSENSDGNLVMKVNGTDYIFTPEGRTPPIQYEQIPNPTPEPVPEPIQKVPNVDVFISKVPWEPYIYVPAEPEPTSYTWKAVNAGQFYAAFANNIRDFRDVLDGTHPDVQGTYVFYSTLDNGLFERSSIDVDLDYTHGFATVGIQTLPEVVANQTASAVYTGTADLELPVTQGEGIFGRGGVGRIGNNLELIMTVDFTGNTVGGLMTYSSSFFDEKLDSNNHSIITLNSAQIVGNGFAGTFSMNENFRNEYGIVDNPTGSYAGNFFGPNADDLAGVMQYKGTTAQGTEVGVGGFRADKQ